MPTWFSASASPLTRSAFAVLTVLLAFLLRAVLDPVIGQGLPLILFYPTVVLSAWFGGLLPGILEDRTRAREAGFDHHLVKPLDHQRLVQILAESGSKKLELASVPP
jgi:hypothetical protein